MFIKKPYFKNLFPHIFGRKPLILKFLVSTPNNRAMIIGGRQKNFKDPNLSENVTGKNKFLVHTLYNSANHHITINHTQPCSPPGRYIYQIEIEKL